jgi:hypothetical protein
MNYAIVIDSMVSNVVVLDPGVAWFDSGQAILLRDGERCGIGWAYDESSDLRFSAPPSPAQSWTAYQFLLRFTAEERAAFRAAAITDPNVADFQQLAQAAQEVVSDDPMTVSGMAYLVSVGLLTSARRDEILGG